MKRCIMFFYLIVISAYPNYLISDANTKKVVMDKNTNVSTTDKWMVDFESKARYFKDYMFILKCRNLIYNFDNKRIIVPVFRGEGEALDYNDFYIFYKKKKIYMINNQAYSSYILPCKQNQVKKTFLEFLQFYKTNIFKDIDISKPVNMVIDGPMWIIDYNFYIDGVPCNMTIEIVSDDFDVTPVDKWLKYKSIYQITPYEKSKEPYFSYSINIGHHAEKILVRGQNTDTK